MQFSAFRVRNAAVAAGALAFLTMGALGPIATAQTPAAGQAQPAPGGAQGGTAQGGAAQGGTTQKNWKDRDEYDLYVKISQSQNDPKQMMQLLQQWQDKYPQSDYSQERNQFWLIALSKQAPNDPQAAQQLVQKAQDILKQDPKNFRAAYFVALYGPKVGGANPSPDVQSEVSDAAKVMLDNMPQKPANLSDEQWTTAKAQLTSIAYNAQVWVASTKKDPAAVEDAYKQWLQADPGNAAASASYAKTLYEDKKIPQALYEYARAASVEGPTALPDAGKQQALNFFKTEYKNYHGNDDGEDQILQQAKTSPLPPDNLNIVSANDIAQQQANAMNQRIASDPAFKIWYAIKSSLQDKGDAFFNSDIKDAEIPGGAEGVKDFTGTVISLDPADRPTKVVLGVESPTVPDATLIFSQPLPAEALQKIQVGQKLDFSGVADSWQKDPYMLTFKDPSIPGVKTAAPARVGRGRHR